MQEKRIPGYGYSYKALQGKIHEICVYKFLTPKHSLVTYKYYPQPDWISKLHIPVRKNKKGINGFVCLFLKFKQKLPFTN